jgi:hypothetical protein
VTREEKVTVLLVILGFVLGGPVGYRRTACWPMLWIVGDLLIVVMLILFAAGVQLRAVSAPWRLRMLLVLVAVPTLPLSIWVGARINDLDFEFRRKAKYEALIAAVTPSLVAHDDESFQVSVPASVDGNDVSSGPDDKPTVRSSSNSPGRAACTTPIAPVMGASETRSGTSHGGSMNTGSSDTGDCAARAKVEGCRIKMAQRLLKQLVNGLAHR